MLQRPGRTGGVIIQNGGGDNHLYSLCKSVVNVQYVGVYVSECVWSVCSVLHCTVVRGHSLAGVDISLAEEYSSSGLKAAAAAAAEKVKDISQACQCWYTKWRHCARRVSTLWTDFEILCRETYSPAHHSLVLIPCYCNLNLLQA